MACVPLVAIACDSEPSSRTPGRSVPAASVAPAAPSVSAKPVPSTRWTFDDMAPGALPQGWRGATGRWEATADKTLRQLAENPTRVYNVLLADARARDLVLRVRMRAISGKIDQGGGLVWRARDTENYYIARHNPLEKNFRVYTVVAGKRTELASADVDRPRDTWYALEIRMTGDRFEGSIDGKRQLDVRDARFAGEGQIGLWTKADAVTDFDDLELEPLDAR